MIVGLAELWPNGTMRVPHSFASVSATVQTSLKWRLRRVLEGHGARISARSTGKGVVSGSFALRTKSQGSGKSMVVRDCDGKRICL